MDLELIHRRFGHISIDIIKAIAKVSRGLRYKEPTSKLVVSRLYEPCEKGRPIRKVRRLVDQRP